MSPYRNKKLLAASNGRPCVRCHKNDGTTVRAHYTGVRQHQYGKGLGQKGHDFISADLCGSCHAHFDQYQGANTSTKIDLSEEFLHLCMLSLARDFEEGIIK